MSLSVSILRPSLALLAVLAFATSPPRAWSQEEGPADTPATDEPNTDEPNTEETANPEPADEDETPDDPFAIPEGDAEELAGFLQGLSNARPEDRSREGIKEFGRKLSAALIGASDRLIAAEDAQEEDLTLAIESKFNGLQIAEFVQVEGAAAKKQEFIDALQNHPRKELVRIAMPFLLVAEIQAMPGMDEPARSQYLERVISYLSDAELGRREVGLISEIGQALEMSEDYERAADFYTRVVPLMAESENERIRERSVTFAGVARRMGLLGKKMDLSGTRLDGQPFDLAEFAGKVVLVDYWATWCGPCRLEMPNVKENYRRYHEKGFEVVGVSLDSSREQVEQYVATQEIPWPILFHEDGDPDGWNHPSAVYYGINAIPATILVDQQGNVVTFAARGPELGLQLKKLLGEPLEPDPADEPAEKEPESPQPEPEADEPPQ